VFFTDACVPAENLVGGLNDGWRVATGSLGHERVMLWMGYVDLLREMTIDFSPSGALQRDGYATLVMLVAGVVVAARNKQLRVVLVGGFLVSWWALLFYGHLTGIVNPNTRLLAPAVPATAVVVAYGIARLRPLWRTAGILLVATVIVASSDHDFRQASADSVSGIGFDAPYYRDSAILPAVRALPRSALIASDQAAVLSWLTGRAPIEEIPSNFLSSAGQQAAMLERLQSSFAHRSGYVAILIASDRRATLLMLASIDVHCRQQQGLLYSCS
jgi:hypothetical protein